MTQHRTYLAFIALIFIGQLGLYGTFDMTSEIPVYQGEIARLKKNAVVVSMAHHESAEQRGPASISEHAISKKIIDKSSFYFLALDQFKKEKNPNGIMQTVEKIQADASGAEIQARAAYEKMNLICNDKLESACLAEIDLLLTQFPESNWTAKSLLLLSHFYFKQNRMNESKMLIQMIQSEFKSYTELSADIQKLHAQNL